MRKEMDAHGVVVKLASIVTLDTTNDGRKLGPYIGNEIAENGKDIRFETKRKGPKVVREVVKNNKTILVTRNIGIGEVHRSQCINSKAPDVRVVDG